MVKRSVLMALALCAGAQVGGAQPRGGAVTASPTRTDTSHVWFRVAKNRLPISPVPVLYGPEWPLETPDMEQIAAISVPEAFKYVGGQRFILQETAEAEQHFFVRADEDKIVRELVWFQVEIGIPGRSRGYTYATDSIRRFAGLEWRVDVRSTAGYTPPPGSDGAAMRAYVEAKGYTLQRMAPRIRLVYLPKPGGMKEFMVIHLTAASAAGADTTFSATLERAKNRLRVETRP
jgi:hypothetical protein